MVAPDLWWVDMMVDMMDDKELQSRTFFIPVFAGLDISIHRAFAGFRVASMTS